MNISIDSIFLKQSSKSVILWGELWANADVNCFIKVYFCYVLCFWPHLFPTLKNLLAWPICRSDLHAFTVPHLSMKQGVWGPRFSRISITQLRLTLTKKVREPFSNYWRIKKCLLLIFKVFLYFNPVLLLVVVYSFIKGGAVSVTYSQCGMWSAFDHCLICLWRKNKIGFSSTL